MNNSWFLTIYSKNSSAVRALIEEGKEHKRVDNLEPTSCGLKRRQCVTEYLHTWVNASLAFSILEMDRIESYGKTKKYPSNQSWAIHVRGLWQSIW